MSYTIHEFNNIDSHAQLPEEFVPGIEECVKSAFGGNITQEDARGHMQGQQILVAENKDVGVIGFTSTTVISPANQFNDSTLPNERGLYFAGAAIAAPAQGTGLYLAMNRRRLEILATEPLDLVYTRTQNPRVLDGITHSIKELTKKSEFTSYQLGKIICRGVYGQMLTSTLPVSRTAVFKELDYFRGDAAILTWRLKK